MPCGTSLIILLLAFSKTVYNLLFNFDKSETKKMTILNIPRCALTFTLVHQQIVNLNLLWKATQSQHIINTNMCWALPPLCCRDEKRVLSQRHTKERETTSRYSLPWHFNWLQTQRQLHGQTPQMTVTYTYSKVCRTIWRKIRIIGFKWWDNQSKCWEKSRNAAVNICRLSWNVLMSWQSWVALSHVPRMLMS